MAGEERRQPSVQGSRRNINDVAEMIEGLRSDEIRETCDASVPGMTGIVTVQ